MLIRGGDVNCFVQISHFMYISHLIYGTIMKELTSSEDAKQVEETWRDDFFAEEGKATECNVLERLS